MNQNENSRGETSLQTVVIVPVVLTILFLSVHMAILGHASHIAQIAAQRGAQVAAVSNGSVDVLEEAVLTTRDVVQDLGGELASTPSIQQTGRTIGVTVYLSAQNLVPFLPHHVRRTVWVAREEFVREQDR